MQNNKHQLKVRFGFEPHNVSLLMVVIIFGAILFLPIPTAAQDSGRWQVGGRLGFDDGRNDEDFTQAEAFISRLFPVAAAGDSPLSLAFAIEASAGILNGGSTRGFVGTIGPGLAAGLWQERVLLRAGISPTIISRDNYGDEDLGGPVQFTSYASLAVRIYNGISVGYRFQHMSNAGLYNRNPGVNLHMIEASWRF